MGEKRKKQIILRNSILITAGSFAVLFFLMYILRGIFIPLVIAFLIAYIFDPVVDFLENRGVRRSLGVGLFVIIILALFIGIMTILIPLGYQEISDFYGKIPKYKEVLIGWLKKIKISGFMQMSFSEIMDMVQKNFASLVQKTTTPVVGFFRFIGGTISFIAKFIIFSLISVYLLYDIDNIREKFSELIPPDWRKKVFDIFKEIDITLKHFLRGQLGVGLITGVLYSIGLTLSGIDFAVLIGLTAGLLNFVPYFGPLFGIIPSVILSLLAYHTFPGAIYHLLGVGLTFGIVQLIEGTFLTPFIIGEELKLNPIIIILSVLIFGKLMGFLGILLAIPTVSILKVILNRTVEYYKGTELYRGG